VKSINLDPNISLLDARSSSSSSRAESFGAFVLPDGGVRFRLWAPAARSIDLVFQHKSLPLQKSGDGWYEHVETKAKAGTLYQYRVNGEQLVPDPASRFQPQDVDGPSEVVDPLSFRWNDDAWKGRDWREAVIYELHVGTFAPGGTYKGVISKIPLLVESGITAIELMPLSDFPGKRNWGYDGVLPYAPDSAYGRPEDLKALVQAAHAAGLMIFLDVVYNHFGPKGNYLSLYAPQFFNERHRTPWGAAINFDGKDSRWVREYFVQNALYWLDEYRFDGLRFDAVHAIVDHSSTHILSEISSRVRTSCSSPKHLVLENDANQSRFLGPGGFVAQWNDDSHHAYHVLATGERDGYYIAYADNPAEHLARCLAEGFAYQGEVSSFSGEARGEPSDHLPPLAFVDFMQNHDQIGNRAFGERLSVLSGESKLHCLTSILLLAPSPPMLFMGEEWGCRQPFLFFCDFDGELGEAVRNGRREEFSRFASFRKEIPDPLAEQTFQQSVLRWEEADERCRDLYRNLLQVRRKEIAPLDVKPGRYEMLAERAFSVLWPLGDGGVLRLIANCSDAPIDLPWPPRGRSLWGPGHGRRVNPRSASWWIER
jgi:malto-oligosyltrehalose trehalohydrolase